MLAPTRTTAPINLGVETDSMESSTTWFFWALLSAVFAAMTAIFAKIGLTGVDSDLATLVRTGVIAVVLAAFVIVTGKWANPLTLPAKTRRPVERAGRGREGRSKTPTLPSPYVPPSSFHCRVAIGQADTEVDRSVGGTENSWSFSVEPAKRDPAGDWPPGSEPRKSPAFTPVCRRPNCEILVCRSVRGCRLVRCVPVPVTSGEGPL